MSGDEVGVSENDLSLSLNESQNYYDQNCELNLLLNLQVSAAYDLFPQL
jgi:hypothetical protein